jgi:hypothetical protein
MGANEMTKPQTPCTVCAAQVSLGKSFFADRGVDWPITTVAGKVVHLACKSEATHIVQVVASRELEISATGVARWVSNNRPLFADTVALIIALGFGDGIDPEATDRAQRKDEAAFLEAYRTAAPREYDAETLHEMRSAFGEGATVVDVVSGQTIKL